ncbi:MAG: AAA family ATPase [Verrucomicrobia bacterium]|nr:AAA family ATPase [Verrucomicrobiota bacterium]
MTDAHQTVAGKRVVYESSGGPIAGLHIANFKAFGSKQFIPFRPLTLVFGANSAGKSSIIHALLLAKHIHERGDLDVIETTSKAGAVDLGGFSQFIHRNDTGLDVCLGLDFSLSDSKIVQLGGAHIYNSFPAVLDPSLVRRITSEWSFGLDATERKSVKSPLSLSRYEIRADGQDLLKFIQDPRPTTRRESRTETRANISTRATAHTGLLLDFVNFDSPLIRRWLEREVKELTGAKLTETDFKKLSAPDQHDHHIEAFCQSEEGAVPNKAVIEFTNGLSYAELHSKKHKLPSKGASRFKKISQLVGKLLERLADEVLRCVAVETEDMLKRTSYLKPLRLMPNREVGLPQTVDPLWQSGGGETWGILAKDKRVRKTVNRWLSLLEVPYELRVEEVSSKGGPPTGTGRKPNHRLWLVDQRSKTWVTHLDVGVGLSQMLPMLVNAAAKQNHIHLIEQPEIHLHPALQARLGDVFIESALGGDGNTFLLETHSEHLILRVLRRVRETTEDIEGVLKKGLTPVKPEDVAVLFVQPGEKGAKITQLPVIPDGDFSVPWPGGFFAERFQELP